VYSCEGPAPTLNGTITSGEWAEECHYVLPLQGPFQTGQDADGNPTWVPVGDASLAKSMTLYVMRDNSNVYFAYQWTHQPGESGDPPSPVNPDRYVLLMAFDFDHDGKFEDADDVVNTIDDGLGLAYLGFDIRIYIRPCIWNGQDYHCSVWLDIFIPKGLYVFSWNSTEGAQVIGGPQPPIHYSGPDGPETDWGGISGPGPLSPGGNRVSFPYAASPPVGPSLPGTYTYTIEAAMPKILFHSKAGFGFFLVQETDGHGSPIWAWPSELDKFKGDPAQALQNPDAAKLLGFLADTGTDPTGFGLLDPGPMPPVGGVRTPVDTVAVILPWLAACAMVGAVTAVWIARKRKT